MHLRSERDWPVEVIYRWYVDVVRDFILPPSYIITPNRHPLEQIDADVRRYYKSTGLQMVAARQVPT